VLPMPQIAGRVLELCAEVPTGHAAAG
jgi:hypothetical protein